ncbi:MAG TPA: hypothetical protein VKD69_22545 [Vicinamibacterales bacterium]|nr:hypothetical protein [Vicinamibacterales bacterium]
MTARFPGLIQRAWQRVEAACAELVRREDIEAVDSPVAAVIRRSVLVGALLKAIDAVVAAWRSSATRALARAASVPDDAAPSDRIRLWAIAIAVGMTVHLVALAATPRARAPFVWVVPACLLAASALVAAGSARLMRGGRPR